MPMRRPAKASTRRAAMLAAAALLVVVSVLAAPRTALTQKAGAGALIVRMAARVLIEADVESPLLIQVSPPERVPAKSYVQVRGLPETSVLSEGHSISPGVWAVPLAVLPSLTIRVPKEAAGSAAVSVRLVSIEGSVLAESRATVVVAASYVLGEKRAAIEPSPRLTRPPTLAPPPAAAAVPPAAVRESERPQPVPQVPSPPAAATPPPSAAPALSAEDRAKLQRYLESGNKHFADGNIAAARGFFRRAAEGGLAEGAVRLGATYDPVELAAMKAQGIDSSPAEARRWYEQARKLGAGGMDARIGRLGAR